MIFILLNRNWNKHSFIMDELTSQLEDVKMETEADLKEKHDITLTDKIDEFFLQVLDYPYITLGSRNLLKTFIHNYIYSQISENEMNYLKFCKNRLLYSIIFFIEEYENDDNTEYIFDTIEKLDEQEDFEICKLIELFQYIPEEYWLLEDFDVKINEEIAIAIEEEPDLIESYPYSQSNFLALIDNWVKNPFDENIYWTIVMYCYLWTNINCNFQLYINSIPTNGINDTQLEILQKVLLNLQVAENNSL